VSEPLNAIAVGVKAHGSSWGIYPAERASLTSKGTLVRNWLRAVNRLGETGISRSVHERFKIM
jgi:hypothetical protein